MKPEIHIRRRQIGGGARAVDFGDALESGSSGRECRLAGARPIFNREDSKHAVTDQLQNVASLVINRGNDRAGIFVERRPSGCFIPCAGTMMHPSVMLSRGV